MAQKTPNGKVPTEQDKQYEFVGSPVKTIKQDRRCTDLWCLSVYVVLFLSLWALAGYSFNEGYPGRLQKGSDVYGNICGYGDFEGRDYIYFADPERSLRVKLCLSGCPVTAAMESICSYDEDLQTNSDYECFNSYPSKPFFNKYCLPAPHALRMKVFEELYSEDMVMTRVVGDLARAWGLLCIAGLIVGGAFVIYLFSLQVPSKE